MTLLFRVIYAAQCNGTHHKLAMDALRYLKNDSDDRWQELFLAEAAQYLKGSKDPDKVFKDFRNHVLHVADNYWGGAATTSRLWTERAIQAFQKKEWQKGVYACGVLSHYLTDAMMPLHTGQTEHEKTIHRACEWSVSKSYELFNPNELAERAAHSVSSEADDWIEQLVVQGAEFAHAEYDKIVSHYDFDRGVKDPPAGLNEDLQITFRRLLRQASLSVAFTIDQIITKSEVTPPPRNLTIKTALAGLSIPIHWVTKKLADHADKKTVQAIYQELQTTGTVEKHLPEDEREVSKLFEVEVLGKTSAPVETEKTPIRRPPIRESAKHETEPVEVRQTAKPQQGEHRFYLNIDDPVVDAPSIGGKTAKRLKQIGILTVRDLVDADVDASVSALDLRYITADIFMDWQRHAIVMSSVPTLRCHDAQILVGCGIRNAHDLATASSSQLLTKADNYVASAESKRYLRDAQPPDIEEVKSWIAAAQTVVDSHKLRNDNTTHSERSFAERKSTIES